MDNTHRQQYVRVDPKLKRLWKLAIVLQSIPICVGIVGIPFLYVFALVFTLLHAGLLLLIVKVNKWAVFVFPFVLLALFFLELLLLITLAWGGGPLWLWLGIVVLLLPSVISFFILRRMDSLLSALPKAVSEPSRS